VLLDIVLLGRPDNFFASMPRYLNEFVKAAAFAFRVNSLLQVVQHMNDGMAVIIACRLVGFFHC
jgi:hypothetical protein